MKKIFTICFLLLLSILNINSEEKNLKRLVILNLSPLGVDASICDAATECLITSVVKTNRFQVVERTQLDKIFNELKLADSDDFEDSTVIEIGQLAKAKMIVVGSVGKVDKEFVMTIRIIEVETGNVLYADTSFAKSVKELLRDTDGIAKDMVDENFQKQYNLYKDKIEDKEDKYQKKLEKKEDKRDRKEAKQDRKEERRKEKQQRKEEKKQEKLEQKQDRDKNDD